MLKTQQVQYVKFVKSEMMWIINSGLIHCGDITAPLKRRQENHSRVSFIILILIVCLFYVFNKFVGLCGELIYVTHCSTDH